MTSQVHAKHAPCYLDANAMMPLRASARQVMADLLSDAHALHGNPATLHTLGRAVRFRIERARTRLAELLNCDQAHLFFTASGTESNFLALAGTLPHVPHLFVGATEHVSLADNAAKLASDHNVPLTTAAVQSDGTADLDCFEAALKGVSQPNASGDHAFLASFMTANHETGVLHPLEEISELCKRYGGFLHTDASQAFGKVPLDLAHADLTTLSSHKIGGPVGIGALVIKSHVPFAPPVLGGGQEDGVRSGTTSLLLVEGFVAAAEEALADNFQHMNQLAQWRQTMERGLQGEAPNVRIWGDKAPRLPQTTYLSMPRMSTETQLMALDLAGFAVSGGAACSSGLKGASPVLTAMGADPAEAECALRVSTGWHTTENDVRAFTQAWLNLYHRNQQGTLTHAA